MKKGKKMLFFILPLCFLSWNGKTFLGVKQASLSLGCRKVLNASVPVDDEKEDIDALFDSSIEKADAAIESCFDYEKTNIGKEYINFYADGDTQLQFYHQEMKERFSFFSEYAKEAQTYLEEYRSEAICFSNLNTIFSSEMNVENGELEASVDFICGKGNKEDFLEAGLNIEYAYVELESMTEKEAENLMRNNSEDCFYHNVYTPKRSRAKRVMKNAFPGCTVHDDATKEHGTGWFFHHFHAYAIEKNVKKKKANHSFYGLPYRLDKD